MESLNVLFKKVNPSAIAPEYGTSGAAGADLHVVLTENVEIKPHQTVMLHTGLSVAIPQGYVGLVYPRSGLACKYGVAPANKVGVIDEDYRGEIMVALHNHSEDTHIIHPNDRVAQMIVMPYPKCNYIEVDSLDDTARGGNGFGSTGGI